MRVKNTQLLPVSRREKCRWCSQDWSIGQQYWSWTSSVRCLSWCKLAHRSHWTRRTCRCYKVTYAAASKYAPEPPPQLLLQAMYPTYVNRYRTYAICSVQRLKSEMNNRIYLASFSPTEKRRAARHNKARPITIVNFAPISHSLRLVSWTRPSTTQSRLRNWNGIWEFVFTLSSKAGSFCCKKCEIPEIQLSSRSCRMLGQTVEISLLMCTPHCGRGEGNFNLSISR